MSVQEPRSLPAPSSATWAPAPGQRAGEAATPAVRVMLVDDHALVRSAVSQAIDAPDVELVAEAATAEDAFALALAVRPDIMLLDIDLPGMNGIQMLEELAPRLPDTKIVMLTVSDSERDMIEALARGAAGYLTKDLSPEALLRVLRGVARGELAMSRRFSARAMRHFVEAARKGRSAGRRHHRGPEPARERRPAHARRRPHRPGDRDGAHHLAAHGRDARQQHPPQAGRAQARRGRAALPRVALTRR